MTSPTPQRTRYAALERRLGRALLGQLRRSWRHASLALLSLLLGYFLSQNLISLLLVRVPGGRPAVVLALVLSMEVLVRLRTRLQRSEEPPGLGDARQPAARGHLCGRFGGLQAWNLSPFRRPCPPPDRSPMGPGPCSSVWWSCIGEPASASPWS